MKTAIVVSGGDAPGINTTIFHLVKRFSHEGHDVVGVRGGFAGLLEEQFVTLDLNALLAFVSIAGSYLPSSRDPVLAGDKAQEQVKAVLEKHAIDRLILFGGDGTLGYVLPLLQKWGIPCVAIPTTIDNDVAGTDYTLGFDSACNFAYHVIDGIRATGTALTGRIFALETLGGNTGYLALEIAYSTGADVVLLPEYAWDEAWIGARLKSAVEQAGQALMVFSEGIPDKEDLLSRIPDIAGSRIRISRLGHAQRGGQPSHRDRKFAAEISQLAYHAQENQIASASILVKNATPFLHEGSMAGFPDKKPDFDLYCAMNGLS